MPVEVRTRGLSRRSVAPAEVKRRAERMLAALGQGGSEVTVLLCDDDAIRALNRDFRGVDLPTDVLAFPMREGEGAELHPDLLGDVAISLETARTQAEREGHAVVREVTFLLAHGLLHLAGDDHRTAAEERAMTARTEELCRVAVAPRPWS
ncbi:MAG: rRNA maturation RNase YbeY [Sandaracinaceae bacterium]